MRPTRREALAIAASAAVAAAAGFRPTLAHAAAADAERTILDFAKGVAPRAGGIALTAPATAENGNAVAVSLTVDSAMAGDDQVRAVMLVAGDNPNPEIAIFTFSALSGAASVTTRIRLARSQTVTAVALMADGSVRMDSKRVEVTIGGCGG